MMEADEVDYVSDEDKHVEEEIPEEQKGKLSAVLSNLKAQVKEDTPKKKAVISSFFGKRDSKPKTPVAAKRESGKVVDPRSSVDSRKSVPGQPVGDSDDPVAQPLNYFSSPPPPTKQSQRVKDVKAANDEFKKTTLKVYETMYLDIKTQTASLNPPFAKSLKEVQEINTNMNVFQENVANLTKGLKDTLPNYPTLMKVTL